jgi:hypothetical protein
MRRMCCSLTPITDAATAQVMTPASAFTMTSRLVIAFASLASRASAATIAAAYPTALATGHL